LNRLNSLKFSISSSKHILTFQEHVIPDHHHIIEFFAIMRLQICSINCKLIFKKKQIVF